MDGLETLVYQGFKSRIMAQMPDSDGRKALRADSKHACVSFPRQTNTAQVALV